MASSPFTNWRTYLIIPPLLIGGAVLAFFIINRRQPQQTPIVETARVLRVLAVPEVNLVPRVLGFGTTMPGRTWRAVARVKGNVVEVHPNLKAGAILGGDEVLLRIDKTEYLLAKAQLTAEIDQVKAQLAEMNGRKSNLEASQKIEERGLSLAKGKLNRRRLELQRGAASPEQVENEEINVLTQEQKLQNLKNSLKTLPAEKEALEAAMTVKQKKLEQAELDLKHTVIKTPFACRLGDVSIEKGQYVAAGEKLFEAYSTDLVEIDAQVPLERARTLVSFESRQLEQIPDFESLRKLFDVSAIVRLHLTNFTTEWKGRFVRMREQLDPTARTVGVVIAVDRPYEKVIPGQRPPLVKGFFVEVELRTAARKALIIPRRAYHDGYVYIVNDKNRLARRKVDIAFGQSDFLVVRDGVKKGELVIVSDPAPAIDGMLVEPVRDRELRRTLIESAEGKGALQ